MSFFCLCTSKIIIRGTVGYKIDTYNNIKDIDPDLISDAFINGRIEGVLPPEQSMECIKIGARQFLADNPNINENVQAGDSVREHFPYVDVFICKDCGEGFIRQ